MKKTSVTALLLALSLSALTGCTSEKKETVSSPVSPAGSGTAESKTNSSNHSSNPTANSTTEGKTNSNEWASNSPADSDEANSATDPDTSKDAQHVVAQPESIAVLVNKQFILPESYEPSDLVYPNTRFIFKEKVEKRKLRKEAAEALEQMFKGAEKDGVYLAGVSAYRSYTTQKLLFNNYVKQDGEKKARTYSAVPGTSEHETGLAIDVSGTNGKCAATDCFAGTREAGWLAEHAPEYGFIIRYPKGKESITGYKYEPWHIRYVGKKAAAQIAQKGITLEEYSRAIPVSK
jgi:D-alanyl-D-alanine carboxypeptidase